MKISRRNFVKIGALTPIVYGFPFSTETVNSAEAVTKGVIAVAESLFIFSLLKMKDKELICVNFVKKKYYVDASNHALVWSKRSGKFS